ncbi:ankyrin repeat [Apiospora arundinis]
MDPASSQNQNIQGITAGTNAMVLAGTFHGCSFGHDGIATRRAKVLDDLRLTDPSDDRAELQSEKGRRLQGTCLWIQDHPDYQNWLQGDCAQLWISGGPGMGKTMLSIFITESLEESSERVTYFFCRHDDEKRNTETAVLRGLLVGLLRVISDESFNQNVWPSFHSDKAASYTLSRPQAIWNVFEALVMSQDSVPTFCILDGLDECDKESSRNLTRRFHDLFTMNKVTHSFKLAVVSRDQSGLRGFSNLRLQECDLHIRHDIELYIASNIRDSLTHKTGFGGWIQKISGELRDRSEGSFLWINFVARDLSTYRTSSEVFEALKRTPKGLEEQYRRILHHIFEDHDEDWQELQTLLAWTALTFEPLTLSQLARAIMGSVTREHRKRTKDLCIYCEHLLVVNDKTGVVRFVHTSVKEFLAQPHHITPISSVTDRTHVDDGHRMIMRTCLKILERRAQSDVLKPYAVKFLPDTWRLAKPQTSLANYPVHTSQRRTFCRAIGKSGGCRAIVRNSSQKLRQVHCTSPPIGGYYHGPSISYRLGPFGTLFQKQNVPMVEWLLQQGAIVHLEVAIPEDAEEYQSRGRSPLVLAFQSLKGHSTLEDWLKSRAMVEAINNKSQVPAQWLLDLFPPPPKVSRTHFKCQALAMGVRRGHVDICEQLLDCGADIYSSWGPGRTPLADAIQFGYWGKTGRMLNLLFDEYDKRIWTSGVENRRDILLQPIINVSLDVEHYEYSHKYTQRPVLRNQGLELCLNRGNFGRFSDSGYSGRFELIGAVLLGHVEQVLVLLRHGANANTVDRHGNSILTLAMQCGLWDMAKALLSHGAEINFVGRTGTTPLIEAVRENELLRRPDDEYPKVLNIHRFLQFFVSLPLWEAKIKTVAALLKCGASTHWRTLAGETALSLAANLADARIVRILVECGARIVIEDQIWYRGLWRCCWQKVGYT